MPNNLKNKQVLGILWKEQSSDPLPKKYIVELKKGHERQKDNRSSCTRDEANQDLLTWKRRQLREDTREVYRIMSSADKMAAHFIFNVRKLAGCEINKWKELFFHTTCRKAMKLLVDGMFKMTKILTGARKDRTCLWKWNSSSSVKYKDAGLNETLGWKLQAAGRAFERNITSYLPCSYSLPRRPQLKMRKGNMGHRGHTNLWSDPAQLC